MRWTHREGKKAENSCIPRDTNLKTRTVLRTVVTLKVNKQVRDKVTAETINNNCCPPKPWSEQDECQSATLYQASMRLRKQLQYDYFLRPGNCCYSLCKMSKRKVLLGGITAVINHHGPGDLGGWKTAGISARPMGTNELKKKESKPLKIPSSSLTFPIKNWYRKHTSFSPLK